MPTHWFNTFLFRKIFDFMKTGIQSGKDAELTRYDDIFDGFLFDIYITNEWQNRTAASADVSAVW